MQIIFSPFFPRAGINQNARPVRAFIWWKFTLSLSRVSPETIFFLSPHHFHQRQFEENVGSNLKHIRTDIRVYISFKNNYLLIIVNKCQLNTHVLLICIINISRNLLISFF